MLAVIAASKIIAVTVMSSQTPESDVKDSVYVQRGKNKFQRFFFSFVSFSLYCDSFDFSVCN